jgi:nucleotide-binding universal stress UspA family protein
VDRFKSILVAASPGSLDTAAVRRIAALVDANDARVTLMDVIEPIPLWRRRLNVEDRTVDIEQMLVAERTAALRRHAEAIGGGEVDVHIRRGKPFIEVIQHTLRNGNDLVIVADPPGQSEGRGHIGSAADVMQLLRKCPVPVWVMRVSVTEHPVVLALVDPDPSDPARDGLNRLILDLAVSMSVREEGSLHVGHAWVLEGEPILRSSEFVSLPSGQVNLLRGAVSEAHQRRLDQLVAEAGVFEVNGQVHLVSGDPGTVLPELASRLHVSLIVMGTVARSGLSGLIMGNTAETILRSVSCSVLALKPEGFETPVRAGRQ